MQFCIAREALGLCLDGLTYHRRETDASLEFHSANVIQGGEGSSSGSVELKLYSRRFDRYERWTIPYRDDAGFSYGVWADRLRDLDRWFDEHGDTPQECSVHTDDSDSEEEAAFMATLRPHDDYFRPFYEGQDDVDETQSCDTLSHLNF